MASTTAIISAGWQLKALFGGPLPWNVPNEVTWASVDDRVRGGASVSHLDEREVSGGHGASFSGVLDTTTLGGAGFASVTTDWADNSTSLDLSDFNGILLRLVKGDGKKYTFIVKDEVVGRRHDGRLESGINWEYDFYGDSTQGAEAPQEVSSGERDASYYEVRIPWIKFKATYRGRDVEDPQPLKTNQIRKFGIMMRSFFEQQHGPFQLVLLSISAY